MNLIPKIRFSQFNSDWVNSPLNDIVDRVTRKNKNNETDLPLTISANEGLVNQEKYFSKKVASKDMTGYYTLFKDEFAYNKSYSSGFPYGAIKKLEKYDIGAVSPLYICFKSKGIYSSDFLKFYFDSDKWYKQIYKIATEGARNHGILNISIDDFFNTRHTLPTSKDEQIEIVKFLNKLEENIEIQNNIISDLEETKRSFIYKIFSQGLRFNNSSEKFPDWEEKLFEDVFIKILDKNRNMEVKNVISNSAKNGLVMQQNYFTKDIANNENIDGYYVIKKNDFVYNPRKSIEAPYGPINLYNLEDSGVVSPLYLCFRAKVDIIPLFFNYYFKSSIWHKYIYINGDIGIRHDRVNIKDSTFFQMPIYFPCLKEQQIIADFLSLFDEKLEIEKAILQTWTDIKQGLLQQMFV